MMACGVDAARLEAFARGDRKLEIHVEGCDDCLRHLAALWSRRSPVDLVASVVRRLGRR